MSDSLAITAIGVAWIVLLGYVAQHSRTGGQSVGLAIAFLYAMFFQYCGFLAYAVPGYSHSRPDGSLYLQGYSFTENTVILGSSASLLGVFGFVIGYRYSFSRSINTAATAWRFMPRDRSKIMVVLGAFGTAGFLLNGLSLPVPMVQAVLQVGRNVAIGVVCLGAILAVWSGRGYTRWLGIGCTLPLSYLVFWGFTSYGFIVFTIFGGFWLCQLAPRRWSLARLAVGSAVITYALLTFFVTWMSFRGQLRSVLWSEAGLGARFSAIQDALYQSEMLSPWNFASLDWINGRLNQYIFVGKMMELHSLAPEMRRNGETLYFALLSWLPRFLWPGKPVMGGSQFVSENTGMRFSESTTFGAGQVFEFYVNFGYAGVLLCFFALGVFLRAVDRNASLALKQGRLFDFVRWFVVGVAFVAPLTDFFFMVNTAVISWLVMTALSYVFLTRSRQDYDANRSTSARAVR